MINRHCDSRRFAYAPGEELRGLKSAGFDALELEAGGDVDRVAFESVLGVEFAVPLDENRQCF